MSLTKLLKAPIKLFMKENITFVIVRRYDLGFPDEKLRYIAVRPSASISMLRQKVWHLLDLPDYCEEVIILKSAGDVEIPLTQLRNGNDPQHPYVLEVWLPGKQMQSSNTTTVHNMITMGGVIEQSQCNLTTSSSTFEGYNCGDKYTEGSPIQTLSNETMALNKLRVTDNKSTSNTTTIYTDNKKSDLTCQVSRSSIFRLKSSKSRDNFISILLKIQNDLATLSSKLANLENRITL